VALLVAVVEVVVLLSVLVLVAVAGAVAGAVAVVVLLSVLVCVAVLTVPEACQFLLRLSVRFVLLQYSQLQGLVLESVQQGVL
jgi:hypothetical protein